MSSVAGNLLGGFVKDMGLGSSYQTPDLQKPVTNEQATEQYNNVNTGLSQQQALNQQLAAQHGIQNQSNAYNALQAQANGTGVNPAQAQLANATQANVANQSALMASQRGAQGNPALLARQAAMQGANTQQQSIGQAAALQAQQQAQAINSMGNLATQQVNQQTQGQQAYNQNLLGSQQNILGGINSQNQAAVGNNSINAGVANSNATMYGNIVGGMAGGAGAAAGMMAEGGPVTSPSGPQSRVGQHFMKFANGGAVPALVSPGEKYLPPAAVQAVKQGASPMEVGQTIPGKPKVSGAKNSYSNDTVKATLEEGGIVLPRSVTQSKNPQWAAHKFVSAVMKQQALKGKK